jgi:thiol-disulfide isomerase/thioredoxin
MRTIISLCFFALTTSKSQAQLSFTISTDNQTGWLMFKGLIDKQTLINEPSFYWYATTQNNFQPDSALVQSMRKHQDSTHFILFGGTWCDDTQSILPRFFKLQEMAGISDSCVSFFAVDRNKNSISNVPQAFGITRVPTIVLMNRGKEIGRLVEYGPKGDWNNAFLELLRSAKK